MTSASMPRHHRHLLTIHAVIFDSQRYVLIGRSRKRWKLPGGHVEANQSLKEALAAEIVEETGSGWKYRIEAVAGVYSLFKGGEDQRVSVIAAGSYVSGSPVAASDEFEEVRWATMNKAMAMLKRPRWVRGVRDAYAVKFKGRAARLRKLK